MNAAIIKRGRRYAVRHDLGRGPDGRRIYKYHSGYPTRKAAQQARTELLGALDRHHYVAPDKTTVAAARPGGDVHREDRRVGARQAACQQVAQPLGIDLAAGQRGVGAAPATPIDRLQAQVRQRRDRLSAQQRIAQLEQRVSAAGAAGVQLGPERTQPREGGSWHRHDRAA